MKIAEIEIWATFQTSLKSRFFLPLCKRENRDLGDVSNIAQISFFLVFVFSLYFLFFSIFFLKGIISGRFEPIESKKKGKRFI